MTVFKICTFHGNEDKVGVVVNYKDPMGSSGSKALEVTTTQKQQNVSSIDSKKPISLVFTCQEGFILEDFIIKDPFGNVKKTINVNASSYTYEQSTGADLELEISRILENSTPEAPTPVLNTYIMNDTLEEFKTEDFIVQWGSLEASITDLRDFISALTLYPFTIESKLEATKINLGGHLIETKGVPLENYIYTLDLGSILIKPTYSNSLDFVNTTVRVLIPFLTFVDIEPLLVIGKTLKVILKINLTSGNTTILFFRDEEEEPFQIENGIYGENIAFNTRLEKIVGDNYYNTVDTNTNALKVFITRQEVQETKEYPLTYHEGVLPENDLYKRVESFNSSKLPFEELEILKEFLNEGFYIND